MTRRVTETKRKNCKRKAVTGKEGILKANMERMFAGLEAQFGGRALARHVETPEFKSQ